MPDRNLKKFSGNKSTARQKKSCTREKIPPAGHPLVREKLCRKVKFTS